LTKKKEMALSKNRGSFCSEEHEPMIRAAWESALKRFLSFSSSVQFLLPVVVASRKSLRLAGGVDQRGVQKGRGSVLPSQNLRPNARRELAYRGKHRDSVFGSTKEKSGEADFKNNKVPFPSKKRCLKGAFCQKS